MKRHFCIVGLRIFKARRLRLFFLNSHEERLDDGPSFKKLAHFFMCFLSLKFGLCPDEGSYCIFIAVGKKKRESVVTHILYSSDVGGGVEKKVGICYGTGPCYVIHATANVVVVPVSVDFFTVFLSRPVKLEAMSGSRVKSYFMKYYDSFA